MNLSLKKMLLVSHGGRESAFAAKLARECCQIFAFAGHVNPTIDKCCRDTGGELAVGAIEEPQAVAEFAHDKGIDYAFVNADGPLSKGVVDALNGAGIKTIGPTRVGSRIEWDKVFSIGVVNDLFPDYCPRFRIAGDADEARAAVEELCDGGAEVVIKPQGLTGGKGVKVMGEHLEDSVAALAYAIELLETKPEEQVLIVEKLDGIEFTIMGFTDGRTVAGTPVTYDYPYRLDGDRGPGTGGMGCFTDPQQPIFFLKQGEYDVCIEILEGVIDRLGEQGARFTGVLNGGFFLTSQGIRFMEFNARIGDPEGINILSLLKTPFVELLVALHHGDLGHGGLDLDPRASVVKYLVSPDYPRAGPALKFRHDQERFADHNIASYFASARAAEKDSQFETVSSSRILALAALGETVEDAAARINRCVDAYADPQLQFRADIGLADNLQTLKARAESIRAKM